MGEHSTIVGGSTAERLINCAGSFQATVALPRGVEVVSDYAEEGTAMHAVMAALMTARQGGDELRRGWDLQRLARSWIGRSFHDRALTAEHCDSMIEPALDHLATLEAHYGGGFRVAGVERQVRFPGILGAFGTMDLLLASVGCLLHIDWKFGAGVPVQAINPAGVLNPQLMFYTTASRYSTPYLYRGKTLLAGAIIQPRNELAELALTHAVIRRIDIKNFRTLLHQTVIAALQPQPPRAKGEHCRFAPCKLTCPLWTGPLIDLSALKSMPLPASATVPAVADPYGDYLARAKQLADLAAIFKAEVDGQMHAFLEAGGKIPGWRLKPKAKLRQWIDEATVARELKALGFAPAEIFRQKLVTFETAEAAARRHKVKIPAHLRVAPPSNETTIATTDDPAPLVERPLLIEQFQKSLQLLREAKS